MSVAMFADDTIVAVSSPAGPAARAIVRLSGAGAFHLLQTLTGAVKAASSHDQGISILRGRGGFSRRQLLKRRLKPPLQKTPLRIEGPWSHNTPPPSRGASRIEVRAFGCAVPAWLYAFPAPNSYTGQHVAELHLPGNPLIVGHVVDELIGAGARAAEAGEFTARAYFNGRIDLTKAEGVAATINAQGEAELRAARQLMAGELARRIAPVMNQLAETTALLEVGIDFTEEDVSFLSLDEIAGRLAEIENALRGLLNDSARFAPLTHRPEVVLVGRPNAGKSTLLNALAGRERAITSPVAGTTRDTLSAEVALPRGIVQLIDVAGLDDEAAEDRNASPEANDGQSSSEAEGAHREIAAAMRRRALEAARRADVVVLVHDRTDGRAMLSLTTTPSLYVLSKADLPTPTASAAAPPTPVVSVSARSGEGMEKLVDALDRLVFGGESPSGKLSVNDRHLRSIHEALDAIGRAKSSPAAATELLAFDLRAAMDALGTVLGVISPDDLLGKIFSTFCIGK